MHDPQDILNNIKCYPCDGKGIDAHYYHISKTTGLKTYIDEDSVKKNYELQLKYAKLGLAPYVRSEIMYGYSLGVGDVWGFLTERVEIFPAYPFLSQDGVYNQVVKLIQSMFEHTQMYIDDCHNQNFGRREDGTVVCVDFGMLCSEEEYLEETLEYLKGELEDEYEESEYRDVQEV